MSDRVLSSTQVSEIEREIDTQPACWRQASRLGASLGEVLPAAGSRVLAVGCGTSLFMGQAFAALREARGRGETDAFPASEAPLERRYDAVVAISRSGTTTEVRDYLRSVKRIRRIALVAVPGSPIATTAGEAVTLEFADERSVVQTRFATSALALLRAHLGEDLGPVIAQGEAALDAELPIDPDRYSHFVFLGRGWGAAMANEAALKLREAARAWAESYPAMEFRHGPISVAGADSVVWAVGPVDDAVLADAASTGATVVGGTRDPMAELILIQRLTVLLARGRGLDPDHPSHLTRSVVLS
jgi:fructoselysine-6-P-deglycase FrlB-like protein